MSGDQMPSLLGRKWHQMPGVCSGGGVGFKLQFDWYISIQENLMSNSAGIGYFAVRLVLVERQEKSFEDIQNTDV